MRSLLTIHRVPRLASQSWQVGIRDAIDGYTVQVRSLLRNLLGIHQRALDDTESVPSAAVRVHSSDVDEIVAHVH